MYVEVYFYGYDICEVCLSVWKKCDRGNIVLIKEENVLCKECGDNCEWIFFLNEYFELLYFLGLLLNYICVVGIGFIVFFFYLKYELEL